MWFETTVISSNPFWVLDRPSEKRATPLSSALRILRLGIPGLARDMENVYYSRRRCKYVKSLSDVLYGALLDQSAEPIRQPSPGAIPLP